MNIAFETSNGARQVDLANQLFSRLVVGLLRSIRNEPCLGVVCLDLDLVHRDDAVFSAQFCRDVVNAIGLCPETQAETEGSSTSFGLR